MSLTTAAQKLLAWFGIYKITATGYDYRISYLPRVKPHGLFKTALEELVTYGY